VKPVVSKKREPPVEFACRRRGEQKVSVNITLLMNFLIVVFAGWRNWQQQAMIDCLKPENEILRRQLKRRRLRLTDDERCTLPVKGRALERKLPAEAACMVTRETILGWHCPLVALKWTFRR